MTTAAEQLAKLGFRLKNGKPVSIKSGRKHGAAAPSKLERAFDLYWNLCHGPELEKEFKFHPERKWRFDRAYPAKKIAFELHGGVYSQGRHTRGKGFENDREKMNAATLMGWRVLELTRNQITHDAITQFVALCRDELQQPK